MNMLLAGNNYRNSGQQGGAELCRAQIKLGYSARQTGLMDPMKIRLTQPQVELELGNICLADSSSISGHLIKTMEIFQNGDGVYP
jgi:hypothetical protein